MKHTLALVTTVGLITFCVFNILHQQTKTVRSLPSDTLSIHKTTVPLKKTNKDVLNIYTQNITKGSLSLDKDKLLDERGPKEAPIQEAKNSEKFYSESYTFITELVKEAGNLSHKLLW
ncbi:hypothetical protein [Lactococcus garvieae]|uniref:hypothetical protein n=1 Tax=Lactococcus garvieae TaxID=1363 RepID=UPI00288C7F84|nr:hypothetical protein [Lactococcus garvieae]MDT2741879.1 hypothetical protein [Lactococcus garvieae]